MFKSLRLPHPETLNQRWRRPKNPIWAQRNGIANPTRLLDEVLALSIPFLFLSRPLIPLAWIAVHTNALEMRSAIKAGDSTLEKRLRELNWGFIKLAVANMCSLKAFLFSGLPDGLEKAVKNGGYTEQEQEILRIRAELVRSKLEVYNKIGGKEFLLKQFGRTLGYSATTPSPR